MRAGASGIERFRRALAIAAAASLLLVMADGAGAQKVAPKEPVLVDEFGRVPEEPKDDDLALPDPLLDRTWPGPKPGEGGVDPRMKAPDEPMTDPFAGDSVDDASSPPAPRDLPPAMPEELRRAVPPRALVGPDGRLDAGSPREEAAPEVADPLQLDELEPSEMDREVARPSALDRGYDDDPYGDAPDDGGFGDDGSGGGFGDGGFGGE